MLPRWVAHAQSVVPIAWVPPFLPHSPHWPAHSSTVSQCRAYHPHLTDEAWRGCLSLSLESWRRDLSCEATEGFGGGGPPGMPDLSKGG